MTRTIPTNANPWICHINGVTYSYDAGTTQDVPEAVAALIDSINGSAPKPAQKEGHAGQIWMMDANGNGKWEDIPTSTFDAITSSADVGESTYLFRCNTSSGTPTYRWDNGILVPDYMSSSCAVGSTVTLKAKHISDSTWQMGWM